MAVGYLLSAADSRILGTRDENNALQLFWVQQDLAYVDGIDLGSCGDTRVVVQRLDGSHGGLWLDSRSDGHLLTPIDRYWLRRAQHILNWRAMTQHCAACGNELVFSSGIGCGVCKSDGIEVWPRVDPEVLVLAADPSDRVTLVHARHWPNGLYSAVSGYVEAGESVEEAAVREVHEETGLRVGTLSYAGSAAWPYPHCLLLAFRATVDDRDPIPDGTEVTSIIRVSRRELSEALQQGGISLPQPASMARTLIDGWLHSGTRIANL